MDRLLKRTCIGIVSVLALIGLIIGGYQLNNNLNIMKWYELLRVMR